MFHMQRQRRLPEEHARFYAAEISLALNFLHDKGLCHYVYRLSISYSDMFIKDSFLHYNSHELIVLKLLFSWINLQI